MPKLSWKRCLTRRKKSKVSKIQSNNDEAMIPWEPKPENHTNWLATHEGFVKNSIEKGNAINVLFYGDSLTAGWGDVGKSTFDQEFASLGIANYGIRGDRTEHLLWRIQNGEVTNLDPKLCMINIGTNNMWANNDTDIARGIEAAVSELQTRLPNMKILLLGVLPKTSEAGVNRTSNINSIISTMDNGSTARFFDMKDHFYRGGNDFVSELYNSDLLHLSAAGYAKWAEAMKPLLHEMLGTS